MGVRQGHLRGGDADLLARHVQPGPPTARLLSRPGIPASAEAPPPADLKYYGPFFDILTAAANYYLAEKWKILPPDCARHLPLVASAAITVLFTYLFAARAYSAASALLATLFLTSFPRFIGHSFNNPKDGPLAMLIIVYYYIIYRRISTGKKSYSLLLAIVGGIAFALGRVVLVLP